MINSRIWLILTVLTILVDFSCRSQEFEGEDSESMEYYKGLIEQVDDSWFLPYRELIINWEENVSSSEALQPTEY